jgi:acyl-CoA thioesterase YciA
MSASAAEGPPRSEPALRAIAMPADANPAGDIFGGWLRSQMDLAGGTVVTRRAKGRVMTVVITAMTFHRPVFVGDEVSCYVDIVKIGRTSITVKIGSWDRRGRGEEKIEGPWGSSPMWRWIPSASLVRYWRHHELREPGEAIAGIAVEKAKRCPGAPHFDATFMRGRARAVADRARAADALHGTLVGFWAYNWVRHGPGPFTVPGIPIFRLHPSLMSRSHS